VGGFVVHADTRRAGESVGQTRSRPSSVAAKHLPPDRIELTCRGTRRNGVDHLPTGFGHDTTRINQRVELLLVVDCHAQTLRPGFVTDIAAVAPRCAGGHTRAKRQRAAPPRVCDQDRSRLVGPGAVDRPRGRSSRGGAVPSSEGKAGDTYLCRRSLGVPPFGQGGNHGRIGHLLGHALHDEVELISGEAQCAARVTCEISSLTRPLPEGDAEIPSGRSQTLKAVPEPTLGTLGQRGARGIDSPIIAMMSR